MGQQYVLKDIEVHDPASLRTEFLNVLGSECTQARMNKQEVLVLIFGHGEEKLYGIWLGGLEDEDPSARLTPQQFRDCVGEETEVCLMTTACFSGGWTIQPDLNISVLTAAGNKEVSESWPQTKSLSRACGSIWASAILATPDFVYYTNNTADPQRVHYKE